MSLFKVQFTACAVLALLSPAAYADLTAEEVWGDWQSQINGMGYRISGAERRTGDDLIVNNINLSANLGAEVGTINTLIERLIFTENGDGTVDIGFPDAMTLEMSMIDADGQLINSEMDFAQTGYGINVSGSPEALRYTFTAQTITMKSSSIATLGSDLEGGDASFNVSLNGVSGYIDMAIGELRNYDQAMKAASLTYDVDVTAPDNDGKVTLQGKMDNLSIDGTGTLPLVAVDAADMNAMLAAGFSTDAVIGYGTTATDMKITAPDGVNSANFGSKSGTLAVKMDLDGLSYDATNTGVAINAQASAFPLPVSFDMAEAGFKLTMPLQKSDESQDFAFGFTLADFTMSDVLWGLFDPSAQLPRDPATLIVDLVGKGRLLFDFLAPEAAEATLEPDFTPGEVESLDLNTLQLTLAGAELTGQGAMTFDNSTPSFGLPKPVGAVDLKLVGGNGLLDKLVAVGLLPEEQAMGARMMMGLLAAPGAGPDTLNSKIEFNEQGHIIANGQRIQ